MNINRLHIKNHCSVRIQTIAKNYGLTTIGQLKTMLDRMEPQAKLSLSLGHVRVARVRKILKQDFS